MARRIATVISLLCALAVTGSAQVRRPTRTRPGTLTPTTPAPPAPILAAFALSLDSISGGPGYQPNGKVTLFTAAPAGGVVVNLASDNPAASVPATVTVPTGATEATFPVTTTTVAAPTQVGIIARMGNVSLTDGLKVLLAVVSVVNEGWVPGSTTQRALRVTMSGPAPPGGLTVVATYGSPGSPPAGAPNACFPLPAFTSAVVPAGGTSGVLTATIDGTLTRVLGFNVVYGSRFKPQQLVVQPAFIAGVDVPTTLGSGATAYATVRLSGTTPTAACANTPQYSARYNNLFTVFINSSHPAVVQVPATARVDPSQSERAFAMTASTVQTPQTVTITVSRPAAEGLAAFVKQVTLSVTP